MSLTITVQPTSEPVTLPEARQQLRLGEDTSHDDQLALLITLAREETEAALGRALITRTYQLHEPAAARYDLRMPPLGSVSAVVAINAAGVETTVTDYTVDTTLAVPTLTIGTLPGDAETVKITYTAGYATAADVPQVYRYPVLLRITQHFFNPEGLTETHDRAFRALTDPHRLNWGF